MRKDKKTIKRDILDKFRSGYHRGRPSLPPFWLELVYLPSLDRAERQLCRRAVSELIDQGLCIQAKRQSLGLEITEKGGDLLWG